MSNPGSNCGALVPASAGVLQPPSVGGGGGWQCGTGQGIPNQAMQQLQQGLNQMQQSLQQQMLAVQVARLTAALCTTTTPTGAQPAAPAAGVVSQQWAVRADGLAADDSEPPRPCSHNQWSKDGKKRGRVHLRCRVDDCREIWRIRPDRHTKCDAFYAGSCELGGDCPLPHVFRRHRDAKGGPWARIATGDVKGGGAKAEEISVPAIGDGAAAAVPAAASTDSFAELLALLHHVGEGGSTEMVQKVRSEPEEKRRKVEAAD